MISDRWPLRRSRFENQFLGPTTTGTIRGLLVSLAVLLGTVAVARAAAVVERVDAALTAPGAVPVSAPGYSARGKEIRLSLGFAPAAGSNLTVVRNRGLDFISGRFSNLKQGQEVGLEFDGIVYRYVANYFGGSGNDLVLVWQRRAMSAWGANSHGELGNGGRDLSRVPVDVDSSGVLAGKTVISLAAGGAHVAAVCSDGTVVTWGSNDFGQLGNDSTDDATAPTKVKSSRGKRIIRVSAGGGHTLGLRTDGSVVAWGANTKGQLGDQSRVNRLTPVETDVTGVLAGRTVVSISAGGDHSLALCSDGTVVSWGGNSHGQLGIGNRKSRNVPVPVDATGVLEGKSVVAVAAGRNFSLALCSDGTVAGWGANDAGQLGDGTFKDRTKPVLVDSNGVLAGKKVKAISAGGSHSLAKCGEGVIAAWGANKFGQLGNGTLKDSNVPVLVRTGGAALVGKKIIAISAGADHSLSRSSGGSMAAWGRGLSGDNSTVPVRVERTGDGLRGKAKLVAAGSRFGVAVSSILPGSELETLTVSRGSIDPAFSPEVGFYQVRVGQKVESISITPTARDASRVTVNGQPVISGSAGPAIPLHTGLNTFHIRVNGAGHDKRTYTVSVIRGTAVTARFDSAGTVPLTGNLGDITGLDAEVSLGFAPDIGNSLTLVENTGAGPIKGRFSNLIQGQEIRISYQGTFYRFVVNYHGGTGNDLVLHWASQIAYAWGFNANGQLGDSGRWGLRGTPIPTEVSRDGVLAGKFVTQVSASDNYSLALCLGGSVVQWGKNDNIPSLLEQTGALSGKTVVSVSAGGSCNLALCSDGTVAAWGMGGNGQLGNGTNLDSDTPVAVDYSGVLAGKKVVEVSAGYYHCLALCADGTLVGWGEGYYGNLGNGTNVGSNVPVLIPLSGALNGKTVISLGAGLFHSLALCSDGTMAAWGASAEGELGTGNTTGSNLPVAVDRTGVLAGKTVVSISVGAWHNLALCSDQTVVAWGAPYGGMLGDNGVSDGLLPVKVVSSKAIAGKKVVALSAGINSSFALLSDGSAAAWGQNDWGKLGDGTLENRLVPVAIANAGGLTTPKFRDLAAGGSHGLAVGAAPLSNDAGLAGLEISDGVLDYGFSAERTTYVASIPVGLTSLTVVPAVRNPYARVKVNGIEVSSGNSSGPVSLGNPETPMTVISIEVTSEKGTTTNYQIEARRAGPVAAVFNTATDVPFSTPAFVASNLNVSIEMNFDPVAGSRLILLNNTGLNFIKGRFLNLEQGQVVIVSHGSVNHQFVVNYFGGDGNDLVLEWKRRTVVAWGGNTVGQLGIGTKSNSGVPVAVSDQGALAGKIVVKLAAGFDHTIALCSDGTLAAWGRNDSGQLGDGSLITRTLPVAVDMSGVLAAKQVIAVAAGGNHSLALCSDGTLVTFGKSGGAMPVARQMVGALAGKSIVGISSASDHDLAVCSDGSVAYWKSDFSSETAILPGDSGWPDSVDTSGILANRAVAQVSAGLNLDLALCTDGTVVSWKHDGSSLIDRGSLWKPLIPSLVDTVGALSGKTVDSVDAGDNHRLLLCSDGTLFGWGNNESGQLGTGQLTTSQVPVAVDTSGILSKKSVVGMAAGIRHSLAICSDGTLAAWGSNVSGQRGDGTYKPTGGQLSALSPVAVVGTGVQSRRKVIELAAGSAHSVALAASTPDSRLSSLMVNPGYLSAPFSSDKTEYNLSLPASTTAFTLTAIAREPSARIVVDGVELGYGAESGPIEINPGRDFEVTVIAENNSRTTYRFTRTRNIVCLLTSPDDGALVSHGYAANGWTITSQLGFSPPTGTNLTLVRNTGIGFIEGKFTDLAQGQEVTLTHGGKVYHYIANYYGGTGNDLVLEWPYRSIAAWGYNSSGQLGVPISANVPLPVAMSDVGVLAGKTVVAIAAGASHSLALASDGTLASWGGAYYLGAGDQANNSSVPVAVRTTGALAGKTVVGISAASGSSLAVCSDGSVVAWGSGSYGELGNGGTVGSNEPVAVSLTGSLAGKSVVSVAVGGIHSLALCSDGTVLAWGRNTRGQLGDGTTINRSLPVAVSTAGVLAGKQVVAISAGFEFSLALCSDGSLVAWGSNSAGQLADPSPPGSGLVPVLVARTGALTGETVIALSQAAYSTPTVLCASGKVITWGGNANGQGNSFLSPWTPGFVKFTGVLAGSNVVSVSSGGSSSMAVSSDGGVVTWGGNDHGQLGVSGLASSNEPVTVASGTVFSGKKALFGAVAYHCLLVQAEPEPEMVATALALSALSVIPTSEDLDHDGIPDLLEYVLHGDPGSPSPGILPTASSNGDALDFHFNRLAASAGDTTQIFQYSADMVHWTEINITAPAGNGVIIGDVDSNGDQSVTVTVPKGFNQHLFGRLRVIRP